MSDHSNSYESDDEDIILISNGAIDEYVEHTGTTVQPTMAMPAESKSKSRPRAKTVTNSNPGQEQSKGRNKKPISAAQIQVLYNQNNISGLFEAIKTRFNKDGSPVSKRQVHVTLITDSGEREFTIGFVVHQAVLYASDHLDAIIDHYNYDLCAIYDSDTLLLSAVQGYEVNMAKMVGHLLPGAKNVIDCVTRDVNYTALHIAAETNPAATAILLDHGASTTVRDAHGHTAIMHCVIYGTNPGVLDVFETHGARVTVEELCAAIAYRGVSTETTSMVQKILELNPEAVNQIPLRELPPVSLAAAHSMELLSMLILAGGDASKRTDRGCPLSRAIASGNLESARYLLAIPEVVADTQRADFPFNIATLIILHESTRVVRRLSILFVEFPRVFEPYVVSNTKGTRGIDHEYALFHAIDRKNLDTDVYKRLLTIAPSVQIRLLRDGLTPGDYARRQGSKCSKNAERVLREQEDNHHRSVNPKKREREEIVN